MRKIGKRPVFTLILIVFSTISQLSNFKLYYIIKVFIKILKSLQKNQIR